MSKIAKWIGWIALGLFILALFNSSAYVFGRLGKTGSSAHALHILLGICAGEGILISIFSSILFIIYLDSKYG